MKYTACGLFLILAGMGAWAHEDDPKVRDRQAPVIAAAYRATESLGLPTFPAERVTLMSWLPLNEFGSFSSGNDCWGYTSPSGREYALMGLNAATAFVDVTDPADARIIAVLSGPSSLWRDVKVFHHHAYTVSEGGGGIQVFDMTDIDNGNVSLVNTITEGGAQSTHNVVINTDSGYLYRTGGTSDTGLRIYDLQDPANPVLVGRWDDRYVHDAQVVSYTEGPYAGKEIAFACAGFNGGWVQTGLSIVDVTDKNNITVINHYEYPVASYSHQGWLSEDRRYFYLNDELDEQDNGIPTTTHILSVADLTNITEVGTFSSGASAIDHNLYVRGNLIFEANYRSGLRVFDATDPLAPTPAGYFDTYPDDDRARFNGLWSVYPFFESGTIIGSDLERGLFVWRMDEEPVFSIFDLNKDTKIDMADYQHGLTEWGECCLGDINGNGQTDASDLLNLLREIDRVAAQ